MFFQELMKFFSGRIFTVMFLLMRNVIDNGRLV